MYRSLVISLVFALGAAVPVSAQVCMSRAPFGVGRAHLGGGFASPPGGKAYSAEAAVGSLRSAFGAVGLSRTIADEADVTTTSFDGRVGYQLSVSQDNVVQVCPFAGLGYLTASSKFGFSNLGDTTFVDDQSGVQYELGAAIGKRWTATETLDVLPSLAAAFLGARTSSTTTIGGVQSASSTTTHSHGLLTASVGFLMERRLTITPFAAVPVRSTGSSSYFGFMATVSLGPQAR